MDAFFGEIRAFPYTYAPYCWAYCNGTLLPTQQYSALYALLGTRFGGDGRNTFGLPNLNSTCVIGTGTGPGLKTWEWGQQEGVEAVTLTSTEMPSHNHTIMAKISPSAALRTATPNTTAPLSLISGVHNGSSFQKAFDTAPVAQPVQMADNILAPLLGSGQPHENRQPVLPINWCICVMDGIWPTKAD